MKPKNYQCRKCGKINQRTTIKGMLVTPHFGWHKWLKCECGARRHFQRRVFQPEMIIREELKGAYQAMEALEADLDRAQRECDEADGYYCSMIDNLRDDIRDLKNEKAELVSTFERIVYGTPVKDIFEDLDSEVQRDPGYESFIAYSDYEAVKKKYGVGD